MPNAITARPDRIQTYSFKTREKEPDVAMGEMRIVIAETEGMAETGTGREGTADMRGIGGKKWTDSLDRSRHDLIRL